MTDQYESPPLPSYDLSCAPADIQPPDDDGGLQALQQIRGR